MGLIEYSELRNKVINQMDGQIKEIKILAVEQWAREKGFNDVIFSNYEMAKEWVEQNINSKKKYKKEFNKFEKELDTELKAIVGDLKNGTRSEFSKKINKISKKYVTPVAKIIIKSIIINFLITQGMGLGLNIASEQLHKLAIADVEKIDFTSGIDFSVTMPMGFLQGAADSVTKTLEDQTRNVAGSIESGIKTTLTNGINGAKEVFQDYVIPFSKAVTSGILGFFQAKGIIRNTQNSVKMEKLENQNEDQTNEIENLRQQIISLKQQDKDKEIEKKIAEKREATIKNLGKAQQMNFIVSGLQNIFKDEDVDIPNIPIKCLSMEEYGTFLRDFLKDNEVPSEVQKEVFTAISLYENNIEALCSDLKLGKTGVVEKFKLSIDSISKGMVKKLKGTKEQISYNMERLVRNAINRGVNKDEVDKYVGDLEEKDIDKEFSIE